MTKRKPKSERPAQTAVLLNACAAVAALLVLGAGARVGALTSQFWLAAIGSAVIFFVVATAMWLIVSAPASPLRRMTARQRQTLAYLATAAGLGYLAVRFWLAATGTADWLPLVDAAVMPVMLAAFLLQAAQMPHQAQWDRRRLGGREINLVLLLSMPALLLLPGGAAQWADALHRLPGAGGGAAAGAPWLAAVTATGVALFFGQAALHALRRPGAAVIVFAAVLFYQSTANFMVVQTSGAVNLEASAHFLAMAVALVMDVVYMVRLYAADEERTLWYALAAGITMAVGVALILLPALAGYPAVTPATIVEVTGGSALLGLWCGWSGAQLGHGWNSR